MKKTGLSREFFYKNSLCAGR
ncbi:hypothetical protein AALC16_08610 [Lachnospiraceae bacterium 29-91]